MGNSVSVILKGPSPPPLPDAGYAVFETRVVLSFGRCHDAVDAGPGLFVQGDSGRHFCGPQTQTQLSSLVPSGHSSHS